MALDYSRIEYLLNPELLEGARVTVVGLGSGGAPVCDHLTMNGVRDWHLYDPDELSPENLVKHPRMRSDLGKPKVEIQKAWIIDRNPGATVEAFKENVLISPNFAESVRNSSLVLVCPDTRAVREFVSDRCVEEKIAFVGASVFRTGIGGEVYSYVPEKLGCYRCLELFAAKNDLNIGDAVLGLTQEEEQRIYGLDERDFKASGLSIDIQSVALIQARMALGLLLADAETSIRPMAANWLVFGNRPSPGIFSKHLEVKRMLLKPQNDCICQIPGGIGNTADRRMPE